MTQGDGGGRHAGARRAAPTSRTGPRALLVLGAVAALIAWGFLAWSAISFGREARGGDDRMWWFLALAGVGAICCLFVALILGTRVLRAVGVTRDPGLPQRPAGGRRRR